MQEGDIQTRIALFFAAYRRAPNATSGVSPYELMFNQKMKTVLDRLLPSDEQTTAKYAETAKEFKSGDAVQFRVYCGKERWGTGRIAKRFGKVVYEVEAAGSRHKRHANQLRRLPKMTPPYAQPVKDVLLPALPVAATPPVLTEPPSHAAAPLAPDPPVTPVSTRPPRMRRAPERYSP